MELIFSTANMRARDRFAAWHGIASRALVPHDAWMESPAEFAAELRAGRIADITFLRIETSPRRAVRSARHIGRTDTDEVFVCRQEAGRAELSQDGRDSLLTPGQVALLDLRVPYTIRFPSEARMLVLKVPRAELQARAGTLDGLTARPLAETADHHLLSELLSVAAAHVRGLTPVAEQIVRQQVIELLGVSLRELRPERASAARLAALARIRGAVEAHLAEPGTNAAAIAAAAGISIRYANLVLAQENLSLMRLLQARRLERCRAALSNPAQAGRGIGEIAFAWGFSDLTHFGRAFRRAYGESPAQYRKRAAEAGDATPPG